VCHVIGGRAVFAKIFALFFCSAACRTYRYLISSPLPFASLNLSSLSYFGVLFQLSQHTMTAASLVFSVMMVMIGCVLTARAFPVRLLGSHKQQSAAAATTRSISRHMTSTTVEKTETEWRETLTPEQFYVLREEGTERPNSSELNTVKEAGTFVCAGCGSPLFVTSTKYESGTGWPSFYAPIDNAAVQTTTDFKLILPRTEVSCATCEGHLGHVFGDGPKPTGQRFCLNGVAMKFQSNTDHPETAATVAERETSNPYRLNAMQVLPGVMINGIMGGLFFQSFVTRLETTGIASPIDVLPLLPAIYFGVLAVRACDNLKMT
jgi:peptide-methionine (R)-S-oxide reductase